MLLTAQGHQVSKKPFPVSALGIEIDAEVVAQSGATYWAEFKGSWQGKRPGLQRTDTVKKALANAFLVSTAPTQYPPVIILTSHLPVSGSSGTGCSQLQPQQGQPRVCSTSTTPAT